MANGQYCGGGFRGAPTASMTDGVMELLIVDLITRRRFFGLVGMYHDGRHIDENGAVIAGVDDVLHYIRCSEIEFSGMDTVCRDGEIFRCGRQKLSVLPAAIRYRVQKMQ